jgi:hypothetical protein
MKASIPVDRRAIWGRSGCPFGTWSDGGEDNQTNKTQAQSAHRQHQGEPPLTFEAGYGVRQIGGRRGELKDSTGNSRNSDHASYQYSADLSIRHVLTS